MVQYLEIRDKNIIAAIAKHDSNVNQWEFMNDYLVTKFVMTLHFEKLL